MDNKFSRCWVGDANVCVADLNKLDHAIDT